MVVRAALALRVHTATVFDDELGYVKLAESIGREGRLALFGDEGLSFSPLYPVVLSPIYALGASAPTYFAIKVVNALLISLAVFPVYGIARFVLPRRFSLLVAFLSVLAPLMSYPSFTMSENLGYPSAWWPAGRCSRPFVVRVRGRMLWGWGRSRLRLPRESNCSRSFRLR